MAKLRFFKGSIVGRIGELVGSTWKGINYMKTFTKPANPRTKAQTALREVFAKLSLWAIALHGAGVFSHMPSARRMTAKNACFKANGEMLTKKVFTEPDLQVGIANFTPEHNITMSLNYDVPAQCVSVSGQVWLNCDRTDTMRVHVFMRGEGSRNMLSFHEETMTISGDWSTDFDMPDPNQYPRWYVYAYITDEGPNGKKLLSKTYHAIFSN